MRYEHRNLEYERYMSLSPESRNNIHLDDLIAIFNGILYVEHIYWLMKKYGKQDSEIAYPILR